MVGGTSASTRAAGARTGGRLASCAARAGRSSPAGFADVALRSDCGIPAAMR